MYTLPILYDEWGEGGLGVYVQIWNNGTHLEGMKTFLHITA